MYDKSFAKPAVAFICSLTFYSLLASFETVLKSNSYVPSRFSPIISNISSIKTLKRSGPSIDPYGTPNFEKRQVLNVLFTFTLCSLS